jgi:hypothetical protein
LVPRRVPSRTGCRLTKSVAARRLPEPAVLPSFRPSVDHITVVIYPYLSTSEPPPSFHPELPLPCRCGHRRSASCRCPGTTAGALSRRPCVVHRVSTLQVWWLHVLGHRGPLGAAPSTVPKPSGYYAAGPHVAMGLCGLDSFSISDYFKYG